MRSLVLTALVGGALLVPGTASASQPAPSGAGDELAPVATSQHGPRPLVARATTRASARTRTLHALFEQAERHEQVEQERAALAAQRAAELAALGWTGTDVETAQAVRPLASYRVSALFGGAGPHWETVHTGLDLAAPTGTTLVAAADATVTSVGTAGAYGLRTVLTLADGTQLWYCHQHATLVSPGDEVAIAEPIGLVGSSGNATGPHLHIEVRPAAGAAVDPVPWFAALGVVF